MVEFGRQTVHCRSSPVTCTSQQCNEITYLLSLLQIQCMHNTNKVKHWKHVQECLVKKTTKNHHNTLALLEIYKTSTDWNTISTCIGATPFILRHNFVKSALHDLPLTETKFTHNVQRLQDMPLFAWNIWQKKCYHQSFDWEKPRFMMLAIYNIISHSTWSKQWFWQDIHETKVHSCENC